jgi:hypothetical protein
MVTEYRTTYLPKAAFLVALGVPLIVCERTDPRTAEFVFNDASGKVEQLSRQYYNGASCPALKYYRALTQLRGEINKALGTLRSKGANRG